MPLRELVTSALLLFVGSAWAQAECCHHCGCDCECRKVCHLKCDMKKVTKVEYSCECEDFCVPGKSEKICQDCCDKPIYKPTCAQVRTKKKLIKHEVTKEEPAYKWVVETMCDECARHCQKHVGISGGAGAQSATKPAMQNRKVSWLSSASSKK